MSEGAIPTPSRIGLLREISALASLPAGLLRRPRGGAAEPATVLVLPGIGTDDRATWLLRRYLRRRGHHVHGWGLGRNHGQVGKLLPAVLGQLRALDDGGAQRLAVVGWSLGGVIAREAAREAPELLKRVITLGTPVVGGPRHTVFGHGYTPQQLEDLEARIAEREEGPIEVPITAIYSRRDAVVAWRSCLDEISPRVQHVEVKTTHLGMMISPSVFEAIAQAMEGG